MTNASPDATPAPYQWLDPVLGLEMVGDEDSLIDILNLADEGLTRDLPAIEQCLASGDARRADEMLHAIKGFVPIFCVESLVEHVTRVELLGKTASAQELAPAYAPLAPQLHQLRDEIRRYRDAGRTA